MQFNVKKNKTFSFFVIKKTLYFHNPRREKGEKSSFIRGE